MSETNLAESSGSLFESHKGYDPRVVFFYFVVAALLLTLVGGLAYQQLSKSDTYAYSERVQSQRRVVVPGPRGVIYARDGTTVLVGNRPRFSVVLYLDELKSEFLREARTIKSNYRKSGLTEAALLDMPIGRSVLALDSSSCRCSINQAFMVPLMVLKIRCEASCRVSSRSKNQTGEAGIAGTRGRCMEATS